MKPDVLKLSLSLSVGTVIDCMESGHLYFAPLHFSLGKYIATYFVIFNSSINFIIYCLSGSQFRTDLRSAFPITRVNNNINVVHVNPVCRERQEESLV